MSDQPKKIYSNEKSSYWVLIVIGLIFIFILGFSYEEILIDINQGNTQAFLALLFPLFGFIAVFAGFKMRQKFLHIGLMPVSLSPPVGQIGGHIGGIIELNHPWEKRSLNLTISCLHKYSNGTGKNSRSQTDIIWQHSSFPVDKPDAHGSRLEFCFDIKDDLPVDGSYNGKGRIHWELMLEGTINGEKIVRHWVIPVERGVQQSDIMIPDHHRLQEKEIKTRQAQKSINQQIHISESADGLYLLSEAGRNNKVSIPFIFAGLVFFGSGIFLFDKAIQGDFLLWLMAPVFLLVGFVILLLGIFLKVRRLESKIIGDQVYVRRMLFKKVIYKRQGILNSASQISLSSSLSSQQGSKKTEYMTITANVVCDDGVTRKLKLVEGIEGRLAGEAMLKKIFSAMQH